MEATEQQPLLETQDAAQNEDTGVVRSDNSPRESITVSDYRWKVFGACLNCLVHSMISASVFVTLWFAFKSTPITPVQLHIGLCMIGYQLLMSHAILSLNNSNSWSSYLTYPHKRRIHWILQLAGSGAAIAGSAIIIREKSVHFTSIHGKVGLAALIFTCISLINGLTSLYAVELRRFIPAKVSKISHILLGTAAFALSSVCLAFGYNKGSFKNWASEEFAYVMIAVTSTYTLIIIVTPSYKLWRRVFVFIKAKIC